MHQLRFCFSISIFCVLSSPPDRLVPGLFRHTRLLREDHDSGFGVQFQESTLARLRRGMLGFAFRAAQHSNPESHISDDPESHTVQFLSLRGIPSFPVLPPSSYAIPSSAASPSVRSGYLGETGENRRSSKP